MNSRTHSASSLKTWEQCNLKYYRKYVEKAPEIEDSVASHLAFGSAVHTGLEEVYKIHMSRFPAKYKFSKNDYDHVYSSYISSSIKEGGVPQDLLAEGWDFLKIRMNEFDYSEEVIGIEKSFSLNTQAGTKFRGFIDKVVKLDDNSIAIVDYKTSKMAFTQSEADSDIQLSMYDLAARILYPEVKNVVLVLDYIRMSPVLSSRSQAQRNLFIDWLDAMEKHISSISSKSVKPSLNPFCGWCSYKHACPAFSKALAYYGDDLKLISEMSTDEVIIAWEKLKNSERIIAGSVNNFKASLERFLKERGGEPINGTDKTVYKTQNVRVSYDLADLRGVIPDKDLLSMARVDRKAVDRYVASNPSVQKEVHDLAKVNYISPSIRVKKRVKNVKKKTKDKLGKV